MCSHFSFEEGKGLEITELIQIISNVGFPIVITLYLLNKFDKRLADLDSSIKTLANEVAKASNTNNKY